MAWASFCNLQISLSHVSEDQLMPSSSNSLLPGMGLEHGLPPVEDEKPKSK